MHPETNDQRVDSPQSTQDMSGERHTDHEDVTKQFNERSSDPGSEAKQPPESRIGTKIGRYEITGVLGQGGMGVVYLAHDTMIERDVAIKILSNEWSADERAERRFLAEAKSAGKLGHPNTVPILELGQEGQSYYLVMEYLPGGTVEKMLEEKGPLRVAEATRIIADACKGLAAAHAVGLVHRDVKPGNLLRTMDGTIKVADFGLVKAAGIGGHSITSPGQVMGTPHFMSPEQCEAKPVDARSDLYSLGATYYSLLTGVNPYANAASVMQMMFAHCNAEIPDPRDFNADIPEACAAIIARSMAKSPPDRYQTAEEMLADLMSVERETAGGAIAPRRPQANWMRRNLKPRLAAALIVVGIVCASVAAVVFFPGSGGEGPGGNASTAPGVTADTITFGTTTAYSGPSRDLGQNMVLGIRTCFSAVNDAGGIHGRRLKLVVLDDGYEPGRALANMKELFEKRKVFAVIGNVGTPTAKVTVPYALKHQRLFIAPYTGAHLLRKDPPDRYVFNYRASYSDETAAIVRYFVDIKGISPKQIAVLAQNDSYGDDGFHGVARALRQYGVREDDILRVGYDRNSVQVTEAVKKIVEKRDEIQAIVMVPTYTVAARFIQKVKDGGVNAQFGIVSFVGSELLAEEFRAIGPKYGDGVLVTQVVPHFESGATGVIRYRKLLAKHHPEARPGFVSLEGFVAAECLVEGLEKAGPNLTTESLVNALESIRDLDLGIGPIMSFGPSRHQASHKVWGTMLDNSGSFRIVELD